MNALFFMACLAINIVRNSAEIGCGKIEPPKTLSGKDETLDYTVNSNDHCFTWILSSSNDDVVYLHFNQSGSVLIRQDDANGSAVLVDEIWALEWNDFGYWIQGGQDLNITFQPVYSGVLQMKYKVISAESNCEQTIYLNETLSFYLPTQNDLVSRNGQLMCNFTFVINPSDVVQLDLFPIVYKETDKVLFSFNVSRGELNDRKLIYSSNDSFEPARFLLEPSKSTDSVFLMFQILSKPNSVVSKPLLRVNSYVKNSKLDCQFTETLCDWKDASEQESSLTKWQFEQQIGSSFMERAAVYRDVLGFRPTAINNNNNFSAKLESPEIQTGNDVLCVTMEYGVKDSAVSELFVTLVTDKTTVRLWTGDGYTGYFVYANDSFEIPANTKGYLLLDVKATGKSLNDFSYVQIKRISSSLGRCDNPPSNVTCEFTATKYSCGWKSDPISSVNFVKNRDYSLLALLTEDNDTARIVSPLIKPSGDGYCFEFELGFTSAPLSVFAKSNSSVTKLADFSVKSAEKLRAQVSLNFSEESQLVFEVVNAKSDGEESTSRKSASIRSTLLKDGICEGDGVTCDFSTNSICQWSSSLRNAGVSFGIQNQSYLSMTHRFRSAANEIRSPQVSLSKDFVCWRYSVEVPLCLEVGLLTSNNLESRKVLWTQCGGGAEFEEHCEEVKFRDPVNLYFQSFVERQSMFAPSKEYKVRLASVWTK